MWCVARPPSTHPFPHGSKHRPLISLLQRSCSPLAQRLRLPVSLRVPTLHPRPNSPPSSHPVFPTQQQQVPTAPQLLLSTLLRLSPVPPKNLLTAADLDGNTALHYASAYGQLKAIRALLAAGANPGAKNKYSWTPVAYSSTVQAEVYFKGLVGGVNESGGAGSSGRGEVGVGLRREGESGGLSRGGGGSGLRIVRTGEEMGSAIEMRGGDGRRRAGSAE